MQKKFMLVGILALAIMLISTASLEASGSANKLKGKKFYHANWYAGGNDLDNPGEFNNPNDEKAWEYQKGLRTKYGFEVFKRNFADWDAYLGLVTDTIISGDKKWTSYEVAGDWAMALIKQGLVYPVSNSSVKLTADKQIAGKQTAYNQLVAKMFTINGKQYGFNIGIPGDSWQNTLVFFNKRMLREAGMDPDLPYNLQKAGTWTWDAFYDIASKVTNRPNNTGANKVYGLSSDDVREVAAAFIFSNNADFITIDAAGKATNKMNTPEFIQACQFYVKLLNDGVMKPFPGWDKWQWDWDWTDFFDGRVAMDIAPEWRKGQGGDMKDDWGYVVPPKGPRASKYRIAQTENIFIIPNIFTKDEVDEILTAYDMWNVPVVDDYKENHRWAARDSRCVDETLPLTKDINLVTYKQHSVVPGAGALIEEFLRTLQIERTDPARLVEQYSQRMNALIAEFNK